MDDDMSHSGKASLFWNYAYANSKALWGYLFQLRLSWRIYHLQNLLWLKAVEKVGNGKHHMLISSQMQKKMSLFVIYPQRNKKCFNLLWWLWFPSHFSYSEKLQTMRLVQKMHSFLKLSINESVDSLK